MISRLSRVSVQGLQRLPLPMARPMAAVASRQFGSIPVPIGRTPDLIYRRPQEPPPSAPLSEDDDLIYHDAQASEPLFDSDPNINPWVALGYILLSLGVLFPIPAAIASFVVDEDELNPATNRSYPYNNLFMERGTVSNGQVPPAPNGNI